MLASLFDLARGGSGKIEHDFWPHESLSSTERHVLEMLEGNGPASTLSLQQSVYADSSHPINVTQIGLEKLEEKGYVVGNRKHKGYRGMGTELWCIAPRGKDLLGH